MYSAKSANIRGMPVSGCSFVRFGRSTMISNTQCRVRIGRGSRGPASSKNPGCRLLSLAGLCLAVSASSGGLAADFPPQAWRDKIAMDLAKIRRDGLTGPPGGLVAVSFEFCIPGNRGAMRDVLAIDPTIACYAQSPGRADCGRTEYLCIGDTHKPNWRDVLKRLAMLDYVKRVERAYFE